LKFKDERPFASVDAAVKKLLEIANGLEADHAGRLQVGAINEQFLKAARQCCRILRRGEGCDRSQLYDRASVGRLYDIHPGRRGPVRVSARS
jgi:hypothetical protein